MLTVITGPMFAGKSSRLISLANSHVIAGRKVGVFKPTKDTRYLDDHIVTHSGNKLKCIVLPYDDIYLRLNIFDSESLDVFCFDEAQFFEPRHLEQVITQLLYICKKTVIVAGLSQDSDGKPFGAMPHLLAIADDIIHLKAVCAKTKELGVATRTYRKDKSNGEQIVVGGSELYEPRSFKEWLK